LPIGKEMGDWCAANITALQTRHCGPAGHHVPEDQPQAIADTIGAWARRQTLSEVELATAEWIDWYNHRRLHGEIGHVPPAEYEAHHYLTATKHQVTVTP
jgi:transposase InsO family protein